MSQNLQTHKNAFTKTIISPLSVKRRSRDTWLFVRLCSNSTVNYTILRCCNDGNSKSLGTFWWGLVHVSGVACGEVYIRVSLCVGTFYNPLKAKLKRDIRIDSCRYNTAHYKIGIRETGLQTCNDASIYI